LTGARSSDRGAAAAGAGLNAGPFQGFFASAAQAAEPRGGRRLGYGPLAPVADLRDGVERLLLPAGFQYRSFDHTGETLTDGTTVPGRHDGMAAFRDDDRPVRRDRRRGPTVLVRNEVNGPVGAFGDLDTAYDPVAGGGTTTVKVDGRGNVERSFVSLNGTQMNCSGGPMPWGSWVTCEETVNGPDVGNDFTGQDTSQEQHREPDRRRVRRRDLQSRSRDAVLQHPGEQRPDLRHLGGRGVVVASSSGPFSR